MTSFLERKVYIIVVAGNRCTSFPHTRRVPRRVFLCKKDAPATYIYDMSLSPDITERRTISCPKCSALNDIIVASRFNPLTGEYERKVGLCVCRQCQHRWNYDEEEQLKNAAIALTYQHKLNELATEVHEIAKSKGWWDEEKSFGDLTALIHSEVSEAFEEFRNHHKPDEIYLNEGKPEGIPIELADAVIRILDVCARYKIDFDAAVRQKIEFNKTRPTKHGGKKL